MKYYINIGMLICFSLAVSGCLRIQSITVEQKKRAVVEQSDVELAQAAVSVERSMQTIAAIEHNKSPALVVKQMKLHASALGLGRLATVDWDGPVEPLVRKLAALNHYQVKVIGHEPAIPVLISLNEKDTYAGDILRKVSLQTKERMKLLVFPQDKIIEIHYEKLI